MEVNGVQMFGYRHSSKYLIFVFTRRKKFIQVWNNLTEVLFFWEGGELSL